MEIKKEIILLIQKHVLSAMWKMQQKINLEKVHTWLSQQ